MTDWLTVDAVKTQLGKTVTTDDSELSTYVDAAMSIVEENCGSVVNETFTDIHDGGMPTVWLRNRPVVSITSVTEYANGTSSAISAAGGTTGSSNGYFLQAPYGRLLRLGRAWAPGLGNITIEYIAGRGDTAPAPIVLAGAILVQHLWSTTKVGGGGGRPTPGMSDSGWIASYAIPNRVMELLRPYLRAPSIA